MPAYVVIDSTVHDAARYAGYAAEGGRVLPSLGGRFLARGGKVDVLEGGWAPTRLVLIEFPDADAARRWHGSPEHAAARRLREGAAEFRCVVAEGVRPASSPSAPQA